MVHMVDHRERYMLWIVEAVEVAYCVPDSLQHCGGVGLCPRSHRMFLQGEDAARRGEIHVLQEGPTRVGDRHRV